MTLHDLFGLAFAVFLGVSLSRLLWTRLPGSITREPHAALHEHLNRHRSMPEMPSDEEIERELIAVEEQMQAHEAIAKRRHDVFTRLIESGRIKRRPHVLGIPILAGGRQISDDADTEPPKH